MVKKTAAIFILLFAFPLIAYPAPTQRPDSGHAGSAASTGTAYVLTAVADKGGRVTPHRAKATPGLQKHAKSFTFTPAPKKGVQSITGSYLSNTTYQYVNAKTGANIASLPAPIGVKVKVVITSVAGDAFLAGTFAPLAANAGSNQVVLTGTKVTLDGHLSTGDGTYGWTQVSGPTSVTLSDAGTSMATFTAPALPGSYVFSLTHGTSATTTVFVTDSVAQIAKSQCVICHAGQQVGNGVYTNWSGSVHNRISTLCYDCHVDANTRHPGTLSVNTVTWKDNGSGFTYADPAGNYYCLNSTCHGTANIWTRDLSKSSHFASHNNNRCASCHGSELHKPNSTFTTGCGPCHTEVAKTYAGPHFTNPAAAEVAAKDCRACHTGDVKYGYQATGRVSGSNLVFDRPSTARASKHRAETWQYATSDACAACHAPIRAEFRATAHWNNHLEYGSEFQGGAVPGQMNANESWTTTEEGKLTTCAYRCHFKPNLGPNPKAVDTNAGSDRPGKDECLACHDPHNLVTTFSSTCMTCHNGSKHGKVPSKFWNSKHWQNSRESGAEFAHQLTTTLDVSTGKTGGSVTYGTTVNGILDANASYKTTENGSLVTCAYRCHFRPGMYPADVTPPPAYVANKHATTYITYKDTLNNKTYTRPGGDACMACHDAHGLEASYQTCLICHTGSKHGKVPMEFWGSKHWKNTFEYGGEFANQIDTIVQNGDVKQGIAPIAGVLNPNDSYTTTENGTTVTCAYRCHFRPGMGPQQNVTGYLANGKSTTYVMYSSPYGAGKFYRPGGNACMACHDPHGLEANARSTCYNCHAGGNHGWSVKAFEKSTHFTGTDAIAKGIGGPTGKACTACHNAHSTEAAFFAYSTATSYNSPVKGAVACQKCHTPGQPDSIYNGNRVGKAPHFQTGTPIPYVGPGKSGNFYATGSYMAPDSTRTCNDCHFHDNTINKGWAEGSHGSTTRIPLVPSASDNWNNGTPRVDYTQAAQKTDCIRCHTAKGFARFWDSAFKNVSGNGNIAVSGAPIACDACHDRNNRGVRGAVRPLPAGYTDGVKTYSGYSTVAYSTKKSITQQTYPDFKNSNICIPCHAGRGTGALIKAVYASPSATPWMIGTRIYSHFAAAAGVVNGSNAYEFSTPPESMHKKIGTGTAYGTGNSTQGPCVGCHMTYTGKTHSLEAIDFTAGAFKTAVCINCHTSSFTFDDVVVKKAQFNAAVNVLRNLLLQRGIDALQSEINSRPGERKGQDMRGNAESQALIATLGLNQITVAERNTGAAFNWWLFGKSDVAQGDTAAYVHNPGYARHIIMDSIDWLDDYQMNASAVTTILAMVGQPQPTYPDGANGEIVTRASADLAIAFASTQAHHFASGVYKTQYVAGNSTCDTCHYSPEGARQAEARIAWSKSGHGNTTASPWTPSDTHRWPITGSTANFSTTIPASDCVRCHTADGFAQFTSDSPFTNVNNLPGDGKTSSPLNCQTCHVNPLNDISGRRAVAQVTTFYNLSTVDKATNRTFKSHIEAQFPNVNGSNICIPCHAGRTNGDNINAINDFTNVGFVNSHYMASAGLMYMKTGFINFTSLDAPLPGTDSSRAKGPMTYGKSLKPNSTGSPIKSGSAIDITPVPDGVVGGVTSAHRRLGSPDIYGRETWTPETGVFDTGGPCVTCHINANVANMPPPDLGTIVDGTYTGSGPYYDASKGMPAIRNGAGHSFSAVSADAAQQVCIPCHADEASLINPVTAAELKLEEARPYFKAALDAIANLLAKPSYGIKYDPALHPYFYDLAKDPGGTTPVTDWTRGTNNQIFGKKVMGACFNLNLLNRDPGAYVHARTYVQRLLFDTIDFLDDGIVNKSSAETLIAINPTIFPDKNDHWVYKAGGARK